METQPIPRTYDQWKDHFLPEGEAHVAELHRLGYYVSDPYAATQAYCSFAAFDAIHLGKTEIDLGRARDMAERMAGVRPALSQAA
jgi:hypothetical protein